MSRVALGFALVGAFLAGGVLMNGMFTRADDKTEPKARGTLYPNWKKLGLTEDQVQSVYKVQAKYRGQIEKLEAQIRDLKKQERVEAEKVLTPAQKQRLKELSGLEGDKEKKPSESAKPTEKRPN